MLHGGRVFSCVPVTRSSCHNHQSKQLLFYRILPSVKTGKTAQNHQHSRHMRFLIKSSLRIPAQTYSCSHHLLPTTYSPVFLSKHAIAPLIPHKTRTSAPKHKAATIYGYSNTPPKQYTFHHDQMQYSVPVKTDR